MGHTSKWRKSEVVLAPVLRLPMALLEPPWRPPCGEVASTTSQGVVGAAAVTMVGTSEGGMAMVDGRWVATAKHPTLAWSMGLAMGDGSEL